MEFNRRMSAPACLLLCLLHVGWAGVGWDGDEFDYYDPNIIYMGDGPRPPPRPKTPQMTEEEANSLRVPKHLQCDACMIMAYQFRKKFDEAHQKRKSLKRFPQYDVYKLVDEVCHDKTRFEKYEAKEIKGVERLSGPGLKTEKLEGIPKHGCMWSEKLQHTCYMYQGDVSEEDMYSLYLENPKMMRNLFCRNTAAPGLTDVCQLQPDRKPIKDEF